MTMEIFKAGDTVVHPFHGVGLIHCKESQWVSGMEFKVLVVNFLRERLTMRVPESKTKTNGLRSLSSPDLLEQALCHLKTPPVSQKKTAWGRRAQEYTNKINSGTLIALAEVIRDLGGGGNLEVQSFSEKQLYCKALDRLLEEWMAICSISKETAQQQVINLLKKDCHL